MRLVCVNTVRRFVGLTVLLFFALPFGLSVAGCGSKKTPVQYCNAGDSGPVVGQVASITLASNLATTGESLNYGQIGTALSASAVDCKGNAVSVKSYTYASTSSFNSNNGVILADINPANGQVCGGTWNRNTSGGVPNYTTCTAPVNPPAAPAPITVSVPATFPFPAPTTLQPASTTTVPLVFTVPAAGLLTVTGDSTTTITTATNGVAGGATAGTPFFVVPNETVSVTVGDVAPSVTLAPAFTYAASASGALQITGGTVSAVYDYIATTGLATLETGVSNITPVQTGDIVGVFYTAAPSIVFSSSDVAAFVTATANGAVSNAIPVFIHPVVTGIELGPQTASCTTDPGTDCCPNNTTGTPVVAPVYTQTACLSQTQVGQLVARVYQGGVIDAAHNVTCQVGHLTYAAQTANIVGIDQNGAATAQQPGSSVITATVSNSSTATQAGFFSTCPPASVSLSVPGKPAGTNSINVNINNLQPLTATVVDTKGNPITGLTLEFNSTTPQTIPTSVGSVTPLYPGSADITAVCQPTTCNTAPFSQIGLFGNGKPITSNPITVTAVGTSSTVLYMGSTSSQYLAFRDFTTNQPSALIKLTYVPNSMVMNQAGTALYLGSTEGLMVVNATTNTLGNVNQSIPGKVISVSPDGNTVVVTDPTRQTVSLVSTASNAVVTSYNGIATSAAWSPDDQAVYITTQGGQVLTHSPFTDWQTATPDELYGNVTIAVPSIGAFFSGPSTTDGRSYCPSSVSSSNTTNPPTITNEFVPVAAQVAAVTDLVASTTSGTHVIGAHAAATASTLTDIDVVLPTTSLTDQACPAVIPANYFQTSFTTQVLSGINAASITGVYPASNSQAAFVTYNAATASGGGKIPVYFPPATGAGTLQYVTLVNGATSASSPISGVFSTDNFTFFTGTTSDNQVHLITLTYPGGTPTATEAAGTVITPQLPLSTGTGYAPITLLAQRPKKSTS